MNIMDYLFNGYIQDYRVYKGVAKYTSNFSVRHHLLNRIAAVSPGSIVANGTQQQPTSTHSTLISTQFVDKRLVMYFESIS